MKKILFVCPYPFGVAAGQRLKFEPHFERLREEGYEIQISSFMSKKLWEIASIKGFLFQKIFWTLYGLLKRIELIFSLKQFDCVYIFMNVFPFGPPIFERIYLGLSKKVIFDIEDNILIEETGSVNWLASILKSKRKIQYLLKNSDRIVTSTPELSIKSNQISNKNNATFIPPTLETTRFIPRSIKKNHGEQVVIGWTGTFSSRAYLDLIIPKLEKLYRKKRFKLMIIGNFEMQNKNLDLEVIQWNAKDEIMQLHNFDIGLYPLPSNEWISGKSGLKALQYMAIGIPAVCSAVGNVNNFIEHEKDGILIFNPKEWISSLEGLIDNADKRKKIGNNARAKFLKNFSQNLIFKQYLSVIEG
jgi:glycosyltransferase involved in cell wall biosynthesis